MSRAAKVGQDVFLPSSPNVDSFMTATAELRFEFGFGLGFCYSTPTSA